MLPQSPTTINQAIGTSRLSVAVLQANRVVGWIHKREHPTMICRLCLNSQAASHRIQFTHAIGRASGRRRPTFHNAGASVRKPFR